MNNVYYSCDKFAMGQLVGREMEHKPGSILDLCIFPLDKKTLLDFTRF